MIDVVSELLTHIRRLKPIGVSLIETFPSATTSSGNQGGGPIVYDSTNKIWYGALASLNGGTNRHIGCDGINTHAGATITIAAGTPQFPQATDVDTTNRIVVGISRYDTTTPNFALSKLVIDQYGKGTVTASANQALAFARDFDLLVVVDSANDKTYVFGADSNGATLLYWWRYTTSTMVLDTNGTVTTTNSIKYLQAALMTATGAFFFVAAHNTGATGAVFIKGSGFNGATPTKDNEQTDATQTDWQTRGSQSVLSNDKGTAHVFREGAYYTILTSGAFTKTVYTTATNWPLLINATNLVRGSMTMVRPVSLAMNPDNCAYFLITPSTNNGGGGYIVKFDTGTRTIIAMRRLAMSGEPSTVNGNAFFSFSDVLNGNPKGGGQGYYSPPSFDSAWFYLRMQCTFLSTVSAGSGQAVNVFFFGRVPRF